MPTPKVQFNIPHSPRANTIDLSSSTIQNTPQTPTQQNTSNIPSDFIGSSPIGEPNLVNDPVDVSSDTILSLPETLSLPSTPSTPSIIQTPRTPFPTNFPTNFDARYRENSTNNIHLRLDWNIFVAPSPLFGQHHENHRLHNRALNRLQYRQDIHKDIQQHNIRIPSQDNLTLEFEITVRLNNIIHHPFSLAPLPPNITVQPLPRHL